MKDLIKIKALRRAYKREAVRHLRPPNIAFCTAVVVAP